MKFFLVIVLSLAVSTFVTAQDSDDWTTIPWNPNDQTLVGALNGGLKDALPQAAHLLGPGQWSLAQVTDVRERSEGDNGTDYDFDVNITNGKDIADLTLTVYRSPGGEVNQLLFWIINP